MAYKILYLKLIRSFSTVDQIYLAEQEQCFICSYMHYYNVCMTYVAIRFN